MTTASESLPATSPQVFAPFFTTRLAQGGSGLGLTICRNMVNGILGGRIEVVSPPLAGTTVTITLPRLAPRTPRPTWIPFRRGLRREQGAAVCPAPFVSPGGLRPPPDRRRRRRHRQRPTIKWVPACRRVVSRQAR